VTPAKRIAGAAAGPTGGRGAAEGASRCFLAVACSAPARPAAAQQTPQHGLQRTGRQGGREFLEGPEARAIPLTKNVFLNARRPRPRLHPKPYSDKFTTFALQRGQEFGGVLTHDSGNRARCGGQFQRLPLAVGNENAFGDRPGQHAAHGPQQGFLAQAAVVPGRKLRIGVDDARKGRQASRPGHSCRRR